MIDFDSLTDVADQEYQDPDVIAPLGLVVAAPAAHGNDLILEAQALVDSMAGLPFVVFIEPADDDPNVEIFANAAEFQQAMDLLRPPTEEEAVAWVNTRISERLEQWSGRLAEAGL